MTYSSSFTSPCLLYIDSMVLFQLELNKNECKLFFSHILLSSSLFACKKNTLIHPNQIFFSDFSLLLAQQTQAIPFHLQHTPGSPSLLTLCHVSPPGLCSITLGFLPNLPLWTSLWTYANMIPQATFLFPTLKTLISLPCVF